MASTTDKIEKRVFLKAPQEKVWRALSDAKAFGDWFGVELDGPFAPGRRMIGHVKPTVADAEIAKMQEKHAGMRFEFIIDTIEPMKTFSYRWHPFAIEKDVDYSKEPMTLVTFSLEPAEGGTMLTVVETGFDALPIARKTDAFEANEEGWAIQVQLVEKYLQLAKS